MILVMAVTDMFSGSILPCSIVGCVAFLCCGSENSSVINDHLCLTHLCSVPWLLCIHVKADVCSACALYTN